MEKKANYFVIYSIVVLLVLLGITLWTYLYYAGTFRDKLIAKDIAQLDAIFEKINDTAQITAFEHSKNNIDFLNIEKFSGSTVGPMKLQFPDRWQGPYVSKSMTMQEKYYQIIKTKDGYYILPGDGAKLSNGKVIGKDVIINEQTNMQPLLADKNYLLSDYGPLTAKIMDREVLSQPQEHFLEPALSGSEMNELPVQRTAIF